MKETTNSKPRMIPTYRGAKSGCHLKIKLATSVSTTNLAVAVGGDVRAALLINEAYEAFGFLRRSRIDVAQEPIERERSSTNQIGRIFDGLWGYMIHLEYHCTPDRFDSGS